MGNVGLQDSATPLRVRFMRVSPYLWFRDFIETARNPVMTKPFELEALHLQVLEVLG